MDRSLYIPRGAQCGGIGPISGVTSPSFSTGPAVAHQAKESKGSWMGLDGLGMFLAGGTAGAIARTSTAPLDRIKLLFQVQAVQSSGTSATAYTGVGQALMKIYKEEGVRAYWKGNGTNIIRIFPYSAGQLMSNDMYKRMLAGDRKQLTVPERLVAGACAGMTATALTHPLDTVRLRLALPNSGYSSMSNCVKRMVAEEGVMSMYKGLLPTLIGIAPYAALNFVSYDMLKLKVYGGRDGQQLWWQNLLMGGAAGTFAATVCYPLDTVRRRMQMKGTMYTGQLDALRTIWRTEGYRGFYRGWAANTVKVVPQNAIRFVSYEFLKSAVGVVKQRHDT